MKVKDVCHKVTEHADVVNRGESVDQVIAGLASNPATRAIYVTDDDQRLVGIISAKKLVNILGARFVQSDTITAETAGDLMFEPISVTFDDTLTHALEVMIHAQMQELPVIDKKGHVLADLNCFELIADLQEQQKAA